MRPTWHLTLLATLFCLGVLPGPAHAQATKQKKSETAVATLPADAAIVPAESGKKKGKGLFGKVKGIAKNKVVLSIAKTAACTMVPGGQYVAGAIDAAASKSAGGAAAGAAGAATGSNCMPGLGAGLGGGQTNAAAGAAAEAQNALAVSQMGAGNRQVMATMQAMQAQMSQMPAGMAGMPGAGGMPGEAGGKPLEVSSDLAGDLQKGKTVVRNIDWVPGTAGVSPAGSLGFSQAMAQVAEAMLQTGGSYRLDLYMDKQFGDAVQTLGPQRLSVVQAAVVQGGLSAHPESAPQIGKVKKDGHPRLEIVKLK